MKVSVSPQQALLALAKKEGDGLAVLSKGLRVYLHNSLYALIIFPKKLKFGKIIALAKKYQKIFKSVKFCISCVILRYYCKKRAKNKKTF